MGLPHIRFVRLLFSAGTVFSLTTIQPEQYFSASFSQISDQRTGPGKQTEEGCIPWISFSAGVGKQTCPMKPIVDLEARQGGLNGIGLKILLVVHP